MIELHRQIEKRYGSAWTLYLRIRRFFVEVNFGRDKSSEVPEGRT